MDDLDGKVAVITGGASGIGLGIATQAAARGMKLVLADIETDPLEAAADRLRADGADVSIVPTDVTDRGAVEALRDAALERHGAIHLLCNNAGVGGGGRIWETPPELWRWIIEVDFFGVLNGIQIFTPVMIDQGVGHIVNTASIAGLTTAPGLGPYNAAKHGVVTLSETLFHELKTVDADIGVSVLCPAFVNTKIYASDRNAPASLKVAADAAVSALGDESDSDRAAAQELATAMQDMVRAMIEGGIDPLDVGDQVLDAVTARQFYILTHPESVAWVRERMTRILEGQDPAGSFG